MKLTVIGSGDASNSGGRGHSCYWLDGATPRGLMVDFGGTALMQLRALGRSPSELGTVAFTHLHGDHVGGWPFLYVDALYDSCRRPRTEPLHVVGPIGTQARLEAYLRVAYGSLADQERGFELTYRELEPGDVAELDGCSLQAFPADHQSLPERPLCLRITSLEGASVAFSGDTRMCDGLRRAADGVDVLVAECTGLYPPFGKHTTWEEWMPELPTIGAKRVLLTHLGGEVRPEVQSLLDAAPQGVDLGFADDGLVLEV